MRILDRFQFDGLADVRFCLLEVSMLDQTLYCMMTWFERPKEVEIILWNAITHHEYLEIPHEMFAGMISATARVIKKYLPEEKSSMLAVIDSLEKELITAFD